MRDDLDLLEIHETVKSKLLIQQKICLYFK